MINLVVLLGYISLLLKRNTPPTADQSVQCRLVIFLHWKLWSCRCNIIFHLFSLPLSLLKWKNEVCGLLMWSLKFGRMAVVILCFLLEPEVTFLDERVELRGGDSDWLRWRTWGQAVDRCWYEASVFALHGTKIYKMNSMSWRRLVTTDRLMRTLFTECNESSVQQGHFLISLYTLRLSETSSHVFFFFTPLLFPLTDLHTLVCFMCVCCL